MATNKNQHYVPRCYLRPFSSNNKAINLYNIDRKVFINNAPIKHQCSKSYFYGKDLRIETALQSTEGTYSSVLKETLKPGYCLTNDHRQFFRFFWLLQHLRTEATSIRAVEMSESMGELLGNQAHLFRLKMREAVLFALRTFIEAMHIIDDISICLLKNKSSIPFYTSDNPAILTNKWYLQDKRTIGKSFGLQSSGTLLLLPLTPKVMCLGYDPSVYSITHTHGWADIKHNSDIHALNQHQFLNCRANIFVHDSQHATNVNKEYLSIESIRPITRHRIHYAILESSSNEFKRFRLIDRNSEGEDGEALIHTETIHANPSKWPRQINWKRKGTVFTDGSAAGYVRKVIAYSHYNNSFRQERVR